MKMQIIKFGSNCLFNKGQLDAGRLNKLWAKQIKEYESGTGVKTYMVISGAVAIQKYFLGDNRRTAEISDLERSSLAGRGQHKLMRVYQEAFQGLYEVSQILVTPTEKEDMVEGVNFANSLIYDMEHGIIPLRNTNDRLYFGESRFDNDIPAARDAVLLNSIDGITVERLVLVTDLDGLYMDPKDKNSLIWGARMGVQDWHYQCCSNESGNGTGGPSVKLDASRMANQAGIDSIIASISHGFYNAIDAKGRNTYFHAKPNS